jgi:predicted RNA binding protein with dsRBD fold (UPF0201 family)
MDQINVEVEADVNPTENEDKVKFAVENMFNNLNWKVKPLKEKSLLIAIGKGMDSLTKLHNLLHREKIRDATRSVLYNGLKGKDIVFYLNKQVAYVGHISFSNPVGESPLGPIKVKIECDSPRELIDWLAPKTV